MVHLPSLLVGLSVAGATTASRPRPHGSNRSAQMSLYDMSNLVESANPAESDCGAERGSNDISLNIDTCLWGDFPLTNFKINEMPTCANGAQAVAYFYPTTSCTGNPNFRSDKQTINQAFGSLYNRCFSLESPTEWSMIFRCDNLESQSISHGYYLKATPYKHTTDESPSFTDRKASDGVVTPHSSFDCTVWKPKEPTYLPADTCLRMPAEYEGRSVLINKPAICADGSVALVESFGTQHCETSSHSETDEQDGHPSEDGMSLDKKCFKSHMQHYEPAKSMRFYCGDKEMVMFEDLPPYEHAEVEPLALHEVLEPIEDKEEPILAADPSSEKIIKPTSRISSQSTKPQSGKVESYYLEECESDNSHRNSISVNKPDTCTWTFMYKSMKVQTPAVCANGTQALFATYSRPGCKEENLKYFGDVPKEFTEGCADISKVDSFAFICDGLPESEIGNKGSVGGFFKFVGIVLLILILMIALSIASCCLRGAAMMKQAHELWARIMDAFKGKDGGIQL